jgi:small subunit ribosomal protein S16
MVRIRLKRLGRKHRPFYRIVVTDVRNRREGAPLVELGYYNPVSKELKLDKQLALEWISKGAQPSETALRLINKADEAGNIIVLQAAKKEKLSRKAAEKIKAEQAAQEAAKAAEEAKKAEEAAAASAEA